MNNYDQKHDRFGRCEVQKENRKFTVETEKCEPPLSGCKYPYAKETEFFETSIRTLLKSYASRGKVDILLLMKMHRSPRFLSDIMQELPESI